MTFQVVAILSIALLQHEAQNSAAHECASQLKRLCQPVGQHIGGVIIVNQEAVVTIQPDGLFISRQCQRQTGISPDEDEIVVAVLAGQIFCAILNDAPPFDDFPIFGDPSNQIVALLHRRLGVQFIVGIPCGNKPVVIHPAYHPTMLQVFTRQRAERFEIEVVRVNNSHAAGNIVNRHLVIGQTVWILSG